MAQNLRSGGIPTIGSAATRFADVPLSYDKKARTVEAVISLGSAVQRWYGIEKLRIASDAVNLERMQSSGIPLLDSHSMYGIDNALGRFKRVWFGTAGGKSALLGEIEFNATDRGRNAEGMVSRGEIKGISAGYQVDEWEITDKDGRVIDPEVERIRWDEEYTFTATKWRLNEASLVSVPADAPAMIRSMDFGSGKDRLFGSVTAAPDGAVLDRRSPVRFITRGGTLSIDAEGSVTFNAAEPAIERRVETSSSHVEAARARMQARQRMIERMRGTG